MHLICRINFFKASLLRGFKIFGAIWNALQVTSRIKQEGIIKIKILRKKGTEFLSLAKGKVLLYNGIKVNLI